MFRITLAVIVVLVAGLTPTIGHSQEVHPFLMLSKLTVENDADGGTAGADDIGIWLYWKNHLGGLGERSLPEGADDYGASEGDSIENLRLVDMQGNVLGGNGHADEFYIVIIDKDSGGREPLLNVVKEHVKQLNVVPGTTLGARTAIEWEPIVTALAQLLPGAIASLEDDYMGIVSVRIWNENGSLRSSWTAVDHTVLVGSQANQATFEFKEAGGDAKYKVTFDLVNQPLN